MFPLIGAIVAAGVLAVTAAPAAAAPPIFQISDVTAAEGTGGETGFEFVVRTPNRPDGGSATVRFRVVADTAFAFRDVEELTGTVTFAPPDTSETIRVGVVADSAAEASETFRVELFDPRGLGSTISDGVGEGTIVDDDGPIVVTLGDVRVREGDPAASVPIRLTPAADGPVTLSVSTSDGSALTGVDYAPFTGSVTFGTSVGEGVLAAALLDDRASEAVETFSFSVSANDPALRLPGRPATVTITDDDEPPALAIGRPRLLRGNRLRVPLSCPAGGPVCEVALSGRLDGVTAFRPLRTAVVAGDSQALGPRLGRRAIERLGDGRGALAVTARLRHPDNGRLATVTRRFTLRR